MPVATEPVRGFLASDFDGPDKPADVPTMDTTTGKIIETPPPPTPEPEPLPEPEKPADTPEPSEKEQTGKKPDEDDEDELPQSLNDALDEEEKSGTRDDKAKAAASKKTADGAAAEKAKAEGEQPALVKARDDDLKVELGAHVRSSTRKIITDFQTKAAAARDKEEAAIARAEAAEARAKEFEEKSKSVEPPKDLVEKIKAYEERIRELDITQDPAIKEKYDRRIEANNTSIIDVLKAQAFDQYRIDKGEGQFEYKQNPNAIPDLLKQGLSFKTLTPLIKKLDEGGFVEEAETIRDAIRENNRIARDKTAEIDSWKGDYTKRQQMREQETKAQAEKKNADFRQQTDLQLNADTEELAKNFPYIKRPPAALPTDTPTTAAAKNKAIAEFDAAAKEIETAVKGLNPVDSPPEKLAEVVGRINANAIQAIMLKKHLIPRFVKDLAAKDARIKQLEAEVGKIVNAGKLSRTQSATNEERGGGNGGKPEATSLEDAFGSGPQ